MFRFQIIAAILSDMVSVRKGSCLGLFASLVHFREADGRERRSILGHLPIAEAPGLRHSMIVNTGIWGSRI